MTFFTLAGALNERFVVGLSWAEVGWSRLIGAPLMVLTARPYGLWRSWLLDRTNAGRGPMRLLAADTAALVLYQVPLYVTVIFLGGARGKELLAGALGATIYMLACGRPYGVWLDFVRGRFGLPPGGQKPMSLGG